jgi:hypothetical protein
VVNAIVRALSHLTTLDWILVGLVFLLIAWGWVRARAFARFGTIDIQDLVADGDSLAPRAVKAQL